MAKELDISGNISTRSGISTMIHVPEQEETNSQGVKRDPTRRRRRRHLNPRAEGKKKEKRNLRRRRTEKEDEDTFFLQARTLEMQVGI